MDLYADIESISYTPLLFRSLKQFDYVYLDELFSRTTVPPAFLLNINSSSRVAMSWWVSAKRTRSYPYGRVYDTLQFPNTKITIIPVFKDEGKRGDRDYIQWDTISLMSLLNVYVIISYYNSAEKNSSYKNKITKQRFDTDHIKKELNELLSFQSSSLHWNLEQVGKIKDVGNKAIQSYKDISKSLGVEMHKFSSAKSKIDSISKSANDFKKLSRKLAKKAQQREISTIQPNESVVGEKASITIKNFLGGMYFFTIDELRRFDSLVQLIEAKHTTSGNLPAREDIKDGLLKMVLFTNIKNVRDNKIKYNHTPVLKLTSKKNFDINLLTEKERKVYDLVVREGEKNGFKIIHT